MKGEMMARNKDRYPMELPSSISNTSKSEGSSPFKLKARTINLSLSGMRLQIDPQVPPHLKEGSELDIELFVGEGYSIFCKVEVIWIKGSDFGVQISSMDAKDKSRYESFIEGTKMVSECDVAISL